MRTFKILSWSFLLLSAGLTANGLAQTVVSIDLSTNDRERGVEHNVRRDGGDGETRSVTCGPAGDERTARENVSRDDDDVADHYLYFRVEDEVAKSSSDLRITGTFFDDPAFAGSSRVVDLQYTNAASTGPTDIPNTFAGSPQRLTFDGSGGWIRFTWEIADAGFRDFMQGAADFRFESFGGPVCVDRVEVARRAPAEVFDELLIGASYYPWWDFGRWAYNECNAGALRLELIPDQPPALGRYDSSNASVIDQHLRWSAEYGVNVWVLEYIAPSTREDQICRRDIFTHPRSEDIRYAVLYDVAIRFGGDLTLTQEKILTARADIRHLARFYFPQPTYLHVDGDRPVVLVYVTRALSGDLQAFEDAMREGAADYGFDVYLVGDDFFFLGAPNASRIARWDAIFGYDCYASQGGYWGRNGDLELFSNRTREHEAAAAGLGVTFFPSVTPGFNDRAIRRLCTDHPALSRRLTPTSANSSLFRELLGSLAMETLDDDIPFVSVTSFNEWHEDTQLEPTVGTNGTTAVDTSPSGDGYTDGIPYDDYGLDYLEIVRDVTTAISGRILAGGEGVSGATIEVLRGNTTVLTRIAFSTGAFTVPRRRLQAGQDYVLRVRAEGFPELVSGPLRVRASRTLTNVEFQLDTDARPRFLRGDTNLSGVVDLSDAVATLSTLFLGAGSFRCRDSADTNDDAQIDLSDAVSTLTNLFLGGEEIPAPGPDDCGPDPTDDDLDCADFPPCSP